MPSQHWSSHEKLFFGLTCERSVIVCRRELGTATGVHRQTRSWDSGFLGCQVGKFVFVSGTPGYDKGKLAVGDFTAQMKQVMETSAPPSWHQGRAWGGS